MLDGFKALSKTYPITIQAADMSGVNDYNVYHTRYKGTESRLLARRVSEDQIQELLNERDYLRFRDGKGDFRVTGFKIADVLQTII